MSDLIDEFKAYLKRVSITRVRMKDVPPAMLPLVKCYLASLTAQLDDEDASWDSCHASQHMNALQAVKREFGQPVDKGPVGNCPRCGGLGYISAYQHIRGGICLMCEGTKNVKL